MDIQCPGRAQVRLDGMDGQEDGRLPGPETDGIADTPISISQRAYTDEQILRREYVSVALLAVVSLVGPRGGKRSLVSFSPWCSSSVGQCIAY